MKGIKDIRIIFIVAVVVVAVACQQTTDPPMEASTEAEPAAPPVAAAEPQPTETLPAQETPTAVGATSSADASSLPSGIQVLSPAYQEAFRLLPDGEWARKLYALEFEDFDLDEWSMLDDTPYVVTPVPFELDRADEFNLMRVLRDEDAQDWVVEKVRELDVAFGEKFEAAETPRERLDVLRQMVKTTEVEPSVLDAELFTRWLLGVTSEYGENEIAQAIARQRQFNDTSRVLWELSAKGQAVRIHELRVCELLMWEVVQAEDTLDVIADGQCDVAKVVQLSKEGLQPDSGKSVPTEAEYRERIEEGDRLRAAQQDKLEALRRPMNTPTP